MSSPNDKDLERTLEKALSNASQWEGSPQAMYHKVRRKLRPQPWYSRFRPTLTLGATALSLLLALGIYNYARQAVTPVPPNDNRQMQGVDSFFNYPAPKPLPVLESEEKLRELISNSLEGIITPRRMMSGVEDSASAVKSYAKMETNTSYSDTNVQIQGVDEADIIKTDGTSLYQIKGNEIVISKIYPDSDMRVLSRFNLPGSIYPQDLYVDGEQLIVVAANTSDYGKRRLWFSSGITNILVYDISDRASPVKTREVEVDGSIISSRKIGKVVYLVTQKWINETLIEEEPTVFYRDTATMVERKLVGYGDICYFPGNAHNSYITVMALDVANGEKEANVEVYLGSGQNIFMSSDHLYVALVQWGELDKVQGTIEKTVVHKFRVADTNIAYQGMGEVPGSILNQFSMDEHQGFFRIATTSRQDVLTNNVYILNRGMSVVGRLEGLAPGEQIYSVRFMGDKGYLVTFEMIDPLFVIDLKDPTNPKVLGELKIPGFSTYLHPLDETTLLGIGRDTEVVIEYGRPRVQDLGLKLAIFDVADVNNPKELFAERIGGPGSYSEALYNHKAVVFHQGTLVLPVHANNNGIPVFQGAMAYRVDKRTGFFSMGNVSHFKDGNPANHAWDFREEIKRSLIVNDVLFAISDAYVTANKLTNGLPSLAKLPLD